VLVPIAVLGWLKFGNVPVAAGDPPLPQERLLTGMPLNARIDRELVKTPPIQADEDNLVRALRFIATTAPYATAFMASRQEWAHTCFPMHRRCGIVTTTTRRLGERRSARRDLLESGQRHSVDGYAGLQGRAH